MKDAELVKNKLESQANVDVTYIVNCCWDELKLALDVFVGSIEEREAVILSFAGHGCELNNCNRLLPKDSTNQVDDIKEHSVNVLALLLRSDL